LNRAGDVATPLRDLKGSVFQPERLAKRGGRPADLRAIWDRVRAGEGPGEGRPAPGPAAPASPTARRPR
jgi:hypothetical protein